MSIRGGHIVVENLLHAELKEHYSESTPLLQPGVSDSKDLLTLQHWSPSRYLDLFYLTDELRRFADSRTSCNLLQGKQLGVAFYESSTRTRLSFESAMHRMGGRVIGFSNPDISRAGSCYHESLSDVLNMLQHYADILIVRHPETGALDGIAESLDVPVINCGDGSGEHPTQVLAYAYTLFKRFGLLTGLRAACNGHMEFRTVHSLFCLAAAFKWKLEICAPPHAPLPPEWRDYLELHHVSFNEHDSLPDAVRNVDVIVSAPVFSVFAEDKEIHLSTQYERRIVEDNTITPDLLQRCAPDDVVVLNALPRTAELPMELDGTKYDLYHRVVKDSVPVRMALLNMYIEQSVAC